ncbi:hypothetical protein HPB47_020505 [Ixodes persulcatus]|uniref:Uncharacterized protein n=1 Tax=Ixodes persulcatus TaxID=34615 RepID=A0AC60QG78_IXOPE|nr:hypothetical protein HPB47_020505 [Ixodes persulcatus]
MGGHVVNLAGDPSSTIAHAVSLATKTIRVPITRPIVPSSRTSNCGTSDPADWMRHRQLDAAFRRHTSRLQRHQWDQLCSSFGSAENPISPHKRKRAMRHLVRLQDASSATSILSKLRSRPLSCLGTVTIEFEDQIGPPKKAIPTDTTPQNLTTAECDRYPTVLPAKVICRSHRSSFPRYGSPR